MKKKIQVELLLPVGGKQVESSLTITAHRVEGIDDWPCVCFVEIADGAVFMPVFELGTDKIVHWRKYHASVDEVGYFEQTLVEFQLTGDALADPVWYLVTDRDQISQVLGLGYCDICATMLLADEVEVQKRDGNDHPESCDFCVGCFDPWPVRG